MTHLEGQPDPARCPNCRQWVDVLIHDPDRMWTRNGQQTAWCCVTCYEDFHGPLPIEAQHVGY